MKQGLFEWDDVKAQSNLAKHGVSFEVSRSAFEDLFALDLLDADSGQGEIRYVIIGMVNGVLLTVVYTERGDRIRIISSRKATAHEEKEYYRSQTAES